MTGQPVSDDPGRDRRMRTVYLWHFVPVIVIAAAFYPTGVMPQPAIGTAH